MSRITRTRAHKAVFKQGVVVMLSLVVLSICLAPMCALAKDGKDDMWDTILQDIKPENGENPIAPANDEKSASNANAEEEEAGGEEEEDDPLFDLLNADVDSDAMMKFVDFDKLSTTELIKFMNAIKPMTETADPTVGDMLNLFKILASMMSAPKDEDAAEYDEFMKRFDLMIADLSGYDPKMPFSETVQNKPSNPPAAIPATQPKTEQAAPVDAKNNSSTPSDSSNGAQPTNTGSTPVDPQPQQPDSGSGPTPSGSSGVPTGVIVGGASVLALLLAGICFSFLKKRKSASSSDKVESAIEDVECGREGNASPQ